MSLAPLFSLARAFTDLLAARQPFAVESLPGPQALHLLKRACEAKGIELWEIDASLLDMKEFLGGKDRRSVLPKKDGPGLLLFDLTHGTAPAIKARIKDIVLTREFRNAAGACLYRLPENWIPAVLLDSKDDIRIQVGEALESLLHDLVSRRSVL